MSASRTWMRRSLLPILAVLAVAGVDTAHAAPSSVGQFHEDTGTVVIRGSDGVNYQVGFRLQASSGAPSQSAVLEVSYRGCARNGRCGFNYKYQRALTASQVSFADANHAAVTTTFAGLPLRLSWTASPDAKSTSEEIHGDPPDSVTVSDPTSGGSAEVSATVFGLTCTGSGMVVNRVGASSGPSAGGPPAPTRAPSAFRAAHHRRPGCQSI
jgi:hypothetical protein